MKERPILFSGPMVRAILSGAKTQTRRVVKYIPALGGPIGWCAAAASGEPGFAHIVGDYRRFCPYGQPGDRLWVRETFLELRHEHWGDPSLPREAWYCHPWPRVNAIAYLSDAGRDGDEIRREYGYRWRPSIHMPRWASRITLEITGVRVERVQDISEADALAEGVDVSKLTEMDIELMRGTPEGELAALLGVGSGPTPRFAFELLWFTLNEKRGYPWASNPWVWVIEFKPVMP